MPNVTFRMLLLINIVLQTLSLSAQSEGQHHNKFTINFYQEWSKTSEENIVMSPFSIYTTLGMVYPGAHSITARQMRQAAGFPSKLVEHHQHVQAVATPLAAPGGPIVITNGLWMQSGFKIEKAFINTNLRYFGSKIHEVNFDGDPDASRRTINTAIEEQTRHKIKDLLPSGSINALTKLVLTNAISFKDGWANPFDSARTKEQDFFLSSGNSVEAQFMEQRNTIFPFYENDLATVLELPYHNGNFSMLIVLPKTETPDPGRFLSSYPSWTFRPGRLRKLQMPKFRIEHAVDPVSILKGFGMTDAFSEHKADFSGITKSVRLFISGIFHKAFIEVNEFGTEAAAATAAVVQAESSVEPVKEFDFVANKPFVFIIRQRTNNTILFIGRVNNPL
jgi:serine protease inhibitor